ncbi:hypothetical protein L209DRAFT_561359 [Thermothelomyces heterothallicus CBS 203.75]
MGRIRLSSASHHRRPEGEAWVKELHLSSLQLLMCVLITYIANVLHNQSYRSPAQDCIDNTQFMKAGRSACQSTISRCQGTSQRRWIRRETSSQHFSLASLSHAFEPPPTPFSGRMGRNTQETGSRPVLGFRQRSPTFLSKLSFEDLISREAKDSTQKGAKHPRQLILGRCDS